MADQNPGDPPVQPAGRASTARAARARPERPGPGPTTIRLDGDERFFVPFAATVWGVPSHFRDRATGVHPVFGRGMPSRAASSKEPRLLHFDPHERAVQMLAVPPDERPGALATQLLPVLERVQEGERLVLGLRKSSRYNYAISNPWADDGGRAAQVIAGSRRRSTEARSTRPALSRATRPPSSPGWTTSP